MPRKHCQSLKTRKRKGKDPDEIIEDLRPEKAARLQLQPLDPDLPGQGQFYCIHCVRYFISEKAKDDHMKSRPHIRKLKLLEDTPYTQREAEAAAGLGTFLDHKK